MQKTALQLLKELISIPSIFPKEEKIAKYCADFLGQNGFETKLFQIEKNRYNVVAEKGNQKKCVLLFGHLDTVPAYNYKKSPFKMEINSDKISGLGSWDMKSGLAIIMSAASRVNLKNLGLKIVFSADEENNSLGSHMIYTKNFLKGVVLGITPEIADAIDKNANSILLGRRGRVVYKINICGVPGHGAALKGISAISMAAEIIGFFEKINFKKNKFLGSVTIFARKIEGKSTSLSLPEKCTIYLDVHYVPPYTKEGMLANIEKAIKQKFSGFISRGAIISVEIAKRNTPYLNPYVTNRQNFYVKEVIGLLSKKIKGLRISAGLTVADENIVGNFGVPVITLGPKGGEAHSLKEWVSKKSIEETEKIYLEVAEHLTGF